MLRHSRTEKLAFATRWAGDANPTMKTTKCLTLALCLLGAGVAQAQPFVEFLGQTFYIARGEMDGSMGVAFDPIQGKVLSVGLTDPCGNDLESPFADQGAAWDPVNEQFWTINQQREVKAWDGDTQVPLFTIPEVFNVPGVGADTLESVRGLALDEQFLYVVDAGPDFGEIESNAWFKFTRDGTPISSSKATDFNANLDAAPDATVDGICWIPPQAPYAAGLFLVALEHSGFQIIDENGFFVDEFIWEFEGISIGAVPFAFSGIAMNPQTGDLYLVENSGSQMYVWVRLPDEPLPVTYSIGFPHLRVHSATGGCARETFFGTGDPGDLFFSLAYRPSDGQFWTSEFNTGELYLLDPRSGLKSDSGIQGPNNIWGMAYDEDNDLMYLHASDDQQLWVHDFETAQTSILPSPVGYFTRDIALRKTDAMLYAVEGGSSPNLIRIHPQTGVGTVVGPTAAVIGLDYDESTDQLVGVDRNAAELLLIDPGTGTFGLLEDLSGQPFSSEALGIIPHRGEPTSSAEGHPFVDRPDPPAILRSFPNPSNGGVAIEWQVSSDVGAEVHILDVSGRVVRRIVTNDSRTLFWNGLDQEGNDAPSGVYLLRGQGPDRATGRVVLRN